MKGVGDDKYKTKAGQRGVVDGVERSERGALVANTQVDQTLPGAPDDVDQRRPNRCRVAGERLQGGSTNVSGAQRHGHVDQRIDRGRMIADADAAPSDNRRC